MDLTILKEVLILQIHKLTHQMRKAIPQVNKVILPVDRVIHLAKVIHQKAIHQEVQEDHINILQQADQAVAHVDLEVTQEADQLQIMEFHQTFKEVLIVSTVKAQGKVTKENRVRYA